MEEKIKEFLHNHNDHVQTNIIVSSDEDMGLSELDKPCIKSLFLDMDNEIAFYIMGNNEKYYLSDYKEYTEQILDYLYHGYEIFVEEYKNKKIYTNYVNSLYWYYEDGMEIANEKLFLIKRKIDHEKENII